MVLVPYEDFADLRDRQMTQLRNAENGRTVGLEKELAVARGAPAPDDFNYRKLQSMYSDFMNHIKKIGKTEDVAENALKPSPVTLPVSTVNGTLLDHIPSRNHARYSKVLDTIRKNPHLIEVVSDGSVTFDGNVHKGSNVDDLLHKALNPRVKGHPIGYDQFLIALAKTDLGAHNLLDIEGQNKIRHFRSSGIFSNQKNIKADKNSELSPPSHRKRSISSSPEPEHLQRFAVTPRKNTRRKHAGEATNMRVTRRRRNVSPIFTSNWETY